MNTLTDQELVDLYINTGNNRYFAQLYTRHYPRVYKRCLFFTSNQADSEDFTQEIFLSLPIKLKSYRGDAKFSTWLRAITANYCIDQLRKQNKARIYQNDYMLDFSLTNSWPAESDEAYYQTFEQVLKQLPQQKWELLMNKYKAGMRINDIARDYNLNPSAVKMQLKRAREYARELYNKILFEVEYLV